MIHTANGSVLLLMERRRTVIKKIHVQCVVVAVPLSKGYYIQCEKSELIPVLCLASKCKKWNRPEEKKVKRSISVEEENGLYIQTSINSH